MLPRNINTLEQKKFMEIDGEVAVRTSARGEFRFTGLKDGGRVTEVVLTDSSWMPLPLVPLTNRNAISIQNPTATPIKINYETPSGYEGMVISGEGERFYDITEAIVLYGRSSSGTVTINVEEIA
jgi:hypothetical protein